jgi:hypothetical protein
MKNLDSFFFLSFFLFSSLAHSYTPKDGNISAILGPFFHRTAYEGTGDRPNSPILGGVGLIAMGDLNDYGSLELGFFHKNKVFFRDQDGDFLAEQSQIIHISMGYRYWQNPYLSWGIAFFSAYPMDQPKTVYSSIAPGHELDTSASDTVRYGFDFSIQGELWSHDRLAVVLDGRYSLPTSHKSNEHSMSYGVLFGLRYFIQGREPRHQRPSTPMPPPPST